MIIILLAIIAACEVLRVVLISLPTSKKTYFKSKLRGVEQMILDLEFKRFKTQEIREDIRREYDGMKSRFDILDAKIKAGKKPDEDQGEFNRLDDQKVLLTRDIGRMEEQLKGLDIEINGSKKTNEFPEGVQGIGQSIDSLRELGAMLKSWIKSV